ncbi:MAG: hypothetical protein JWQ72_2720 [Polaromonas sp.]|nr:hypothetical protein [Polaromonas sp.]
MAYAAYSESFNGLRPVPAHRVPPVHLVPENLVVLDLTVPSCDAYRVRRLLAACPHTGVLRCIPRLRDRAVMLEIQLPAEDVRHLLHLLMTSLPIAEVGTLSSWREHLTTRGITHGY